MSHISIKLTACNSTAVILSLLKRKGQKCHHNDWLSLFAQFIVATSRSPHSPQWDIWVGRSRQALPFLHISLTISTLTWPGAQAQAHCSDTAAASYEDVMCELLAVASFQPDRTGGKKMASHCHVLPSCNSRRCLLEQMWEEGKSGRLALTGG